MVDYLVFWIYFVCVVVLSFYNIESDLFFKLFDIVIFDSIKELKDDVMFF